MSEVFDVDVRSPVTIELAVRGFEVLGKTTEEMRIEVGAESPSYAFRLRVLPTNEHLVVVHALQHGMVLAQIRIDTFRNREVPLYSCPSDARRLRVRIDAKGAVTLWEGTNDKPSSSRGPAGPRDVFVGPPRQLRQGVRRPNEELVRPTIRPRDP